MSKKRSRTERRFRAVQRLEDVEITVQEPCPVAWETMKGDRFVRFCSVCELHVYSFAGLQPDEIVALLNQHEGKLCAQFYARPDGTMTIEPCEQSVGDPKLERGGLIIRPHDLTPLPPDHASGDDPEERHDR
jgi:hypothetical protein